LLPHEAALLNRARQAIQSVEFGDGQRRMRIVESAIQIGGGDFVDAGPAEQPALAVRRLLHRPDPGDPGKRRSSRWRS
jgi:hypothetical protein